MPRNDVDLPTWRLQNLNTTSLIVGTPCCFWRFHAIRSQSSPKQTGICVLRCAKIMWRRFYTGARRSGLPLPHFVRLRCWCCRPAPKNHSGLRHPCSALRVISFPRHCDVNHTAEAAFSSGLPVRQLGVCFARQMITPMAMVPTAGKFSTVTRNRSRGTYRGVLWVNGRHRQLTRAAARTQVTGGYPR